MANEGNLRPPTTEEARERGRKGGIASGKVRAERKTMKKQMEMLLSLSVKNEGIIMQLEAMGVNSSDIDNQMALQVAMLQSAMRGDVKAYNAIRELVGERVVEVNVNATTDKKVRELEEYINARTSQKVD